MKSIKKALTITAAFVLCVGVLLFCVNFVAYNKNFFDAQFKVNQTADALGISHAELDIARDKLIDYISGKQEKLDIDFFTKDELSHMADVRAVFGAIRILAFVLMASGIVILALIFIKEKNKIWKYIAWGGGTFLALLTVVGLAALLDFDGVFAVFHRIAFPQGNWQFGQSSQMLVMLPSGLFTAAAFIIVGAGVAFAAVLTLTTIIINAKVKTGNLERNCK